MAVANASVPSYLEGYKELYRKDPRRAALAWFADAGFGLFMHYGLIRELQPQALIAFKQGANGDEDFASPERHGHSLADRVREQHGPRAAEIAHQAWERNRDRHNEICDTLQPRVWGYKEADEGQHLTPDEVLHRLASASGQNCNLLLNTGPLPDGSIHPEDVRTLREVGRRIRQGGWPTARSTVGA